MNIIALCFVGSIFISRSQPYSLTCKAGWTKYADSCYKLYTVQKTWVDAFKSCQTEGSSLVDVGLAGEQTFLQNFANGYEIWMSGSDVPIEGQWLWYGSIKTWVYEHWNSGEPNDLNGEDCLGMLNGGLWNDWPCSHTMAYVCKQINILEECDLGWSFRNNKCYKLITTKATWSAALSTCKSHSSNLVNIADSGENTFVRGLLPPEFVWMGGFDGQTEGSWVWSGGSFVWNYSNWNPGQPDNSGEEDCLMMYGKDGTWYDYKCAEALPFICEKQTCPKGTYGANCNNTCGHCLGQGRCQLTNGTCLNGCEPGYIGNLCETRCENGTYGENCNKMCGHCIDGEFCDHTNGSCLNGCNPGYVGDVCKTSCDNGTYGERCNNTCGHCHGNDFCSHINGTCLAGCDAGFVGELCVTPCNKGYYGNECSHKCGYCLDQFSCHHINGTCLNGCESGYNGNTCKTICENGTYGKECANTCGHCIDDGFCFHTNGSCLNGCGPGYVGELCKTECGDGTYGKVCNDTCGYCLDHDVCHHTNGSCPKGCKAGYIDHNCKTRCTSGTYGKNCNNICGHCHGDEPCFHINGTCFAGCDSGYTGDLCKLQCRDGTYGKECNDTCGYCLDQDVCHHTNGSCPKGCKAGYIDHNCKTRCTSGTYGKNCNNVCGHCFGDEPCFHINGTCFAGCDSGYTGDLCKLHCDNGTYGKDCNNTCGHCIDKNSCFHTNGTCLNGCEPGFTGELCKSSCEKGTYGQNCDEKCGNCVDLDDCNRINGTCLNGCSPGYFGALCKSPCDNGYYGKECNNTCGYCLDLSDCFHINGTCLNGCESGYIGDMCKSKCSNGTYGKDCSKPCGHCLDKDDCHHINGTCVKGCDPGYVGNLCIASCNLGNFGEECKGTCGHCLPHTSCSHVDGTCISGCDPGYIGDMCTTRVLEVLHFEANNLVVREGTGIDFKLLLLSKSDYEFQWFHKEYEVTDASTRYRLYMSQMENGTSLLTLHIAKSLQRDGGDWKIRVSTNGTYVTRNLSITVIPRLLLVIEPMFDFSVEEGESFSLHCSVQNPESLVNIENGSLELTKDGNKLPAVSNTKLSTTWYNEAAKMDDAGLYTCLHTTYPDPVSVSVYATVMAQEQKRCRSDHSGDILWNATIAGATKKEPCPSHQKGTAARYCNSEGVWESPNLINCTTVAFLNASSELDTILEDGVQNQERTEKVITNTLHMMNNITSTTSELSAGDLSSSIDILEKIVNVTNTSGSSIAKEVFFSVVDNVLSSNNSKSWNTVSEKTEKDASSLLKNIDRLSEVVIKNDNISATRFTELTINKTKIDETGIRFPEASKESDALSTFFQLEKQERKIQRAMGYVAVIYKNIADILPTKSERPEETEKSSLKKAFVNSQVLSLTTQTNIGLLNPPLNLTFLSIQKNGVSGMLPFCVSWDFTVSKWTERGCKLLKRDNKETVCECDHLTNFAILMRPYTPETEQQSLKIMSLIGVILSIIFIILTFMIYILTWRFIKSDQNIMMLNLCASLVLAYIVFIASVEETDNEGLCIGVTAVLHYLFLVTFFNMLGMGVYYFMSITVTFYAMYVANNFKSKSRIHWFLLGTWGIPFIIAMISMGSFWGKDYHLQFYCWLSTESGSIYMFVVPVCLIAVINVLIIVSLVRVLYATSAMANSPLKKKAISGLRSLGTLLPVLGITWLFGILAVNEKADAFQYIFVFANSLQGFFIFVSHVLLNKKVMLGLRKQYPVLNTLVSLVESSKEESSSVSRTNSLSGPHSALQKPKKRNLFERYFRGNGKRNKVEKSESFLTENTVSTDCTIEDTPGNSVEMSENGSDSNKLQLIVEEEEPKRRLRFQLNLNPWKKKYTVTGM
uniref:Uncharacterized protein LOC111102569 isoform X2 n=1 Tax=Crassostrea virginica TaxID=6565 RepID=A0A8B8AIS7_CRAVI|nr:uncharacterized protein LOC111102569 isoform X2 [Crassostrea virginica]